MVDKKSVRRALCTLGIVVSVILAGCSDDSTGGRDGGPTDGGAVPDGYGKLYPCDNPGRSCNAHNTCAINPTCQGNLCIPSSVMDCDDELACTEDTCAGSGLCRNAPKKGKCALPVTQSSGGDGGTAKTQLKCFDDGDRNPSDQCKVCKSGGGDGGTSGTKWSLASGGTCDDKNQCTKDDYCQNGVCKGTDYAKKCADTLSCTEDLCDGKGGCKGHKLKTGYCLISSKCYKDGQNHPSGSCFECDTSKSTTKWTALKDTCLIGGKCFKKGDKNPAGCGTCAPATSTTKWTISGTTCCLIKGVAYKSGVKDSINCSTCDPTKSKTDWTPLAGLCRIRGRCYKSGEKHPNCAAECDPTKSKTEWTVTGSNICVIGGACKSSGAKDPIGCSTCDPTKSKTSWTPKSGCFKIVFTTLNKADDGDLGGTSSADAECAKQAKAAGMSGTFKAFLSSSKRDVKDLITGTNATSVAVVNTKGQQLYSSWNAMFGSNGSPFGTTHVYSFDGTLLDENTGGGWYDARAWHGSDTSGKKTTNTCQDWSSASSSHVGAHGELDLSNYWPVDTSTKTTACDEKLAVVCVQTGT